MFPTLVWPLWKLIVLKKVSKRAKPKERPRERIAQKERVKAKVTRVKEIIPECTGNNNGQWPMPSLREIWSLQM